MGVIGSVVAGIGTALLGNSASKKASKDAKIGYDYLSANSVNQGSQQVGAAAQNHLAALLGLSGDPAAAEAAFNQFKDSTGYQFRMNQGVDAITGGAAARGLLNSGSTAQGITQYGQDIASAEFNNYMNQLLNQQQTGLSSAANVASEGSSAAPNVASATMQGYGSVASGLGTALQPWLTQSSPPPMYY